MEKALISLTLIVVILLCAKYNRKNNIEKYNKRFEDLKSKITPVNGEVVDIVIYAYLTRKDGVRVHRCHPVIKNLEDGKLYITCSPSSYVNCSTVKEKNVYHYYAARYDGSRINIGDKVQLYIESETYPIGKPDYDKKVIITGDPGGILQVVPKINYIGHVGDVDMSDHFKYGPYIYNYSDSFSFDNYKDLVFFIGGIDFDQK